MYPSGCKVKIDGKFNLCYIKYIQHVSKGEKIMGRNKYPEITENRILEMAMKLFIERDMNVLPYRI